MATAYYSIDSDLINSTLTDVPVGIKIEAATGFMSGLGATDWQTLHATVDDVECFVEIALWDTTNEEAVLWVKVPSVSSSEDTIIKVETGANNYERAISSPEVIDSFTGDDDDTPNTDLWDCTQGSVEPTIQSNKLNMVLAGGSSMTAKAVSKFVLTGDFDIEVDVEINSAGNSNYRDAFLSLEAANGYKYRISREYRDSTNKVAIWKYEGSWSNPSNYSTTENSLQFRAVRSSSTLTLYYSIGAGWVSFHTDSSAYSGEMTIWLCASTQTNYPANDVSFDNFTINSCDGITGYVSETGEVPAQNVWDSDFAAVYHMCQDPSGGTDCILDSTSNENHGTPGGSMTSGDLVDGGFGKAIDFETDDYINLGDVFKEDYLSIAALFCQDVTPGDFHAIISNTQAGGWVLKTKSTGNVSASFYSDGSYRNTSDQSFSIGSYEAVVVAYEGTSKRIYGKSGLTEEAETGTAIDYAYSNSTLIGAEAGTGSTPTGNYINGKLSELIIFNTALSSAYMKAFFHALNNSLLSYSATDPDLITTGYTDLKYTMENISDERSIAGRISNYFMTSITDKREMR